MQLRDNMAMTVRLNNNDCWNVALALATDRDYNLVRKNLKAFINSDGSMASFHTSAYLEKYGYERVSLANYNCKTLRSFADDTQYTNYKYVVSVSGHVVYIYKGVIHDSFNSDLKRVLKIMRKKVRKTR